MHPAPSIIFFTTFSGLGFGLLFWLGVDATPPSGWVGFVFFALAFALSVGGLLSSTFHLGRPDRAWRAFSQWRTSWLSREAWAAVVTLICAGLYALGAIFLDQTWTVLGWLAALGSLATVFTTSMIYAQLKTVPRWNSPVTPVLFLALSLAGGALLSGRVTMAMGLIVVATAVQIYCWMRGDSALAQSGTNLGTATGLGDRGTPRAFEAPHTGSNYLLREMAFQIGRKHAMKLRLIALVLMAAVPVLFLALPFGHVWAAVAVLSHVAGVLTARWLFFAQAEHVVSLYYGRDANPG